MNSIFQFNLNLGYHTTSLLGLFFQLTLLCMVQLCLTSFFIQIRKFSSLPASWVRPHGFDEFQHFPDENYCGKAQDFKQRLNLNLIDYQKMSSYSTIFSRFFEGKQSEQLSLFESGQKDGSVPSTSFKQNSWTMFQHVDPTFQKITCREDHILTMKESDQIDVSQEVDSHGKSNTKLGRDSLLQSDSFQYSDSQKNTLAFLFLLMQNIEYGNEWDKFFDPKFRDFFRIYAHQAGIKPGTDQEKVMKSKPDIGLRSDIPFVLIEYTFSAWCQLMAVELALLKRALQDKSNSFFILASQSHIPLVPFPQFYHKIFGQNTSRFCFAGTTSFDVPSQCTYAAWPAWGPKYKLKHHQWLVVQREHAYHLVYQFTQEVFDTYSRQYTFEPLCSDEVIPILTLLNAKIPSQRYNSFDKMLSDRNIQQECLTFAYWRGCLHREDDIMQRFIQGTNSNMISLQSDKQKREKGIQIEKDQLKFDSNSNIVFINPQQYDESQQRINLNTCVEAKVSNVHQAQKSDIDKKYRKLPSSNQQSDEKAISSAHGNIKTIASSDTKGTFGLKQNVHPVELKISEPQEFAVHLVESGYLMARKLGSLPMVSFLSNEDQYNITGENLLELQQVSDNVKATVMCKNAKGPGEQVSIQKNCKVETESELEPKLSQTSASETKLDLPIESCKNAKSGPDKNLNKRISLISGFPIRKTSLNYYFRSNLGAEIMLLTADILEPFRNFIALLLLTIFLFWISSDPNWRNIYRTRFFGVLLFHCNICLWITYWLKFEGKEYFLSRSQMEELRRI